MNHSGARLAGARSVRFIDAQPTGSPGGRAKRFSERGSLFHGGFPIAISPDSLAV